MNKASNCVVCEGRKYTVVIDSNTLVYDGKGEYVKAVRVAEYPAVIGSGETLDKVFCSECGLLYMPVTPEALKIKST